MGITSFHTQPSTAPGLSAVIDVFLQLGPAVADATFLPSVLHHFRIELDLVSEGWKCVQQRG